MSPADAQPVSREVYEKLVAADIAWLSRQPPGIERDHILGALAEIAELKYGLPRDALLMCLDIWAEHNEAEAAKVSSAVRRAWAVGRDAHLRYR